MISKFSSFKGKRVFITGHTGFKGAWLSFWLAELGAIVMGYALPATGDQKLFSILNLRDRIEHVEGDICDLEHMTEKMNQFNPDFVFHLAAQSLVRYSYHFPRETFETNVLGSVNVCEAVRQCSSVRSFIYVTSDKCYKNKEWIWGYRENDELGGHDPYSASKGAAEVVFSSYINSFFSLQDRVGVASVRAGNVIGGGDYSQDRIVPDSIQALMAEKPISIRSPHAVRPWQHVLEPLSGYMLLALYLYESPQKYMGAWNFGPDSGSVKKVSELVSALIDSWGAGELTIEQDTNAPHEAGLLTLNCDKARFQLNWEPVWDFSDAVEQTVQWFRSKDHLAETRKQINKYMGIKYD